MTTVEPAEAIQGTKIGAICDRCNRRVKSGDLVRFYATVYPEVRVDSNKSITKENQQ